MNGDLSRDREVVFLLHGICKSRLDMARLARVLRRDGFETVNWGYRSRFSSMEEIADELAGALEPYEGRRVSFVTHSMGGIIVRHYLSRHAPLNVGRFVMIAPPNQGAYLADCLGDKLWFKLVFGPAGQELREGATGLCAGAGVPECEFGVIAGGVGRPRGMNPLVPGDNDGTISVECTRLEGMADFVIVPYAHPYIQFMPRTARHVVRFLRSGKFADPLLSASVKQDGRDQ